MWGRVIFERVLYMKLRKMTALLSAVCLLFTCSACASDNPWGIVPSGQDPDHIEISLPEIEQETETVAETIAETEPAQVDPNGETYILFTSDVHCGVDEGFGYAGVYQIRQNLEAQGYNTVLVDDGDAIQGEAVGMMTQGEAIIDIMNATGYDIAVPGNHEFDYGVDRFLELAGMADYPYLSCNFNSEGELVLEPYAIVTFGDIDIGFVGVTTPETLTTTNPAVFENEDGEFIYDFMNDDDGTAVYEAVQNAVDAVREEGADLVYVIGHMGEYSDSEPWTASDIISHTTGIDVFLDGHSHDTDEFTVTDADGIEVTRCAPGTKLECIGYSHISADGEIIETGLWTWTGSISIPDLIGIDNEVAAVVNGELDELTGILEGVVATSSVDLTISDPAETDENGAPVRMVRSAETNLGDLTADALRDQTGADIAFVNGGGIRISIPAGDVTYGDIYAVFPFNNQVCVIEASGQQILDALEWGVHLLPDEFGGFFQTSGLSYEVDCSVESGCTEDEYEMFTGVNGERRVSNVMVGEEPIDPDASYTVAGSDYLLLYSGNGYSMFADCTVINRSAVIDSDALINYISDTLGGVIGEEYSDPYGQGRITIN